MRLAPNDPAAGRAYSSCGDDEGRLPFPVRSFPAILGPPPHLPRSMQDSSRRPAGPLAILGLRTHRPFMPCFETGNSPIPHRGALSNPEAPGSLHLRPFASMRAPPSVARGSLLNPKPRTRPSLHPPLPPGEPLPSPPKGYDKISCAGILRPHAGGSSSGGRARAFQALGRGFEARLPLHFFARSRERIPSPAPPGAKAGKDQAEVKKSQEGSPLSRSSRRRRRAFPRWLKEFFSSRDSSAMVREYPRGTKTGS